MCRFSHRQPLSWQILVFVVILTIYLWNENPIIVVVDAFQESFLFSSWKYRNQYTHSSKYSGRTVCQARSNNISLIFESDICVISSPLPTTCRTEAIQFVSSTLCRNHYLSGGGTTLPSSTIQLQEEPRTIDLMNQWYKVLVEYNSFLIDNNNREKDRPPQQQQQQQQEEELLLPLQAPQPDDKIVSTIREIQFPGLRLVNKVYSGVTLCNNYLPTSSSSLSSILSNTSLPLYQLVVIHEERQVFGALPIVWLYRKLIGEDRNGSSLKNVYGSNNNNNNNNKNSNMNDQHPTKSTTGTMATTILYLKELPSGGKDEYVIGLHSKVRIRVDFSKFLLKILPTTMEQMELQGSASVQKAIQKDVMVAMETIGNAFHQWKQQQTITKQQQTITTTSQNNHI